MVEPQHPGSLTGTVASAARPRPPFARPQRCLWPGCRAVLPHDHDCPVCSCHLYGYRLEHDPHANDLVLHMLLAAYPDALNLTKLLGARYIDVRTRVAYLRRHMGGSCWTVKGSTKGHGYWVAQIENTSRRAGGARTQ